MQKFLSDATYSLNESTYNSLTRHDRSYRLENILMNKAAVAMAKLSGIRKSVVGAMEENVSRNRSQGELLTRSHFPPEMMQNYFEQAANQLALLKEVLPELYEDFQGITTEPDLEMATPKSTSTPLTHYSRTKTERLVRDIDQIFEIRANSELAQPKEQGIKRVFISHGRSPDWREVQSFIEKDINIQTLELAQEPNLGKTIIEKLTENSATCSSAVIIMTGDDVTNGDEARVRENVMHEIGFFQGSYGRKSVILLHEEGVNIPSNLSGAAYIPFPKGSISAAFHVLQRELRALYNFQ